jgi:hypothetical protein
MVSVPVDNLQPSGLPQILMGLANPCRTSQIHKQGHINHEHCAEQPLGGSQPKSQYCEVYHDRRWMSGVKEALHRDCGLAGGAGCQTCHSG